MNAELKGTAILAVTRCDRVVGLGIFSSSRNSFGGGKQKNSPAEAAEFFLY